jgi:hypothetical protein
MAQSRVAAPGKLNHYLRVPVAIDYSCGRGRDLPSPFIRVNF